MIRISVTAPLLLVTLTACPAPAPPPQPPLAPLPAAATTCYAGLSTGMGQSARTIARRTVDPAGKQIIEDVSHDDSGAHGAKSFHVVMAVTGEQFTMTEQGGAFSGTGTLVGEPWKWTAWSSKSTIPNAGIEITSDDELIETGMVAKKTIAQGGKVIATTTDELKTFDCAQWDAVLATLAVPPLDAAACERACRNFATLKFWDTVAAELDALPAASRDPARAEKAAELTSKLDAHLAACVQQCLASNDAVAVACMGGAASVAQLATCEK